MIITFYLIKKKKKKKEIDKPIKFQPYYAVIYTLGWFVMSHKIHNLLKW